MKIYAAIFKDGGMGCEPKNVGSLQKLVTARKQILLQKLQKEHSLPYTFILEILTFITV